MITITLKISETGPGTHSVDANILGEHATELESAVGESMWLGMELATQAICAHSDIVARLSGPAIEQFKDAIVARIASEFPPALRK